MAVIEGVDYAWNGPSADTLARAGKRFAVRYGGPGSSGKQLTAPELRNLQAAGIAVVANAEGPAGGFRGTAAGRSWAASAQAHFGALGMSADRPIYFSVDWAAGPGDWADIDAACRGASSVIGAAQVGVYGGYATVAHCHGAGTASWLWQTYAWSGLPTRWHPANHLEQYRNDVTIGGAVLDLTRAMQDDYGQWGVDMPLTPDEIKAIANEVWGHLLDVNITAGQPANQQPAGGILRYLSPYSVQIRDAVGGKPGADTVVSLVKALNGTVAPPVITQEALNAAVLAALRELLRPTTP